MGPICATTLWEAFMNFITAALEEQGITEEILSLSMSKSIRAGLGNGEIAAGDASNFVLGKGRDTDQSTPRGWPKRFRSMWMRSGRGG
jgi:hypothetical protein